MTLDISGQRFSRLYALHPTDRRVGTNIVWRFMCDCGNTHEATAKEVKRGGIQSCGCLPREFKTEPSEKDFKRMAQWLGCSVNLLKAMKTQ